MGQELFALYEPYAVQLASKAACKLGLRRWLPDLIQEARLALWEAISTYDPTRHPVPREYICWKARCLFRNALRPYLRWERRELHETALPEEP